MREEARVCPRMTDSNEPGGRAGATGGLPADLMRDAARRLGLTSLACAGGFASVFVAGLAFRRLGWNLGFEEPTQLLFNGIGFVVSLAMFVLSWRHRLSSKQFLAVAIAYEVVGGLIVVYPDQALLAGRAASGIPGVSWLAVWIVVFSTLIPARPVATVVAGLVTATMSPLALWLVTLGGHPWPSADAMANAFIPNYVVAVFVAIPAVGRHRMSRAVTEARDLGSYRLVEQLGSGGMGEVWRAEHRMLSRPAAIKLIGSEALAHANGVEVRELIRRFKLEARATASLNSPHTVALYDFGVTDDGTLYYVMELLGGLDLEKMVKRYGAQPAERAVHLLAQICDSLDEAHAFGMVHRDIKPANVQVSRLGRRYDRVKVLDFGLVKQRRTADAATGALTAAHGARGTPAFIPPEMASGGVIDARTDLYGVGCVAYWLLTGQMVFEGRTHYEVISHHLQTAPVPASERTELPVPPELDRIVLDCLAKDPAQRPASARELARRLAAVPFERPWSAESAESWWRLHLPQDVLGEGGRASGPSAAVPV